VKVKWSVEKRGEGWGGEGGREHLMSTLWKLWVRKPPSPKSPKAIQVTKSMLAAGSSKTGWGNSASSIR
jgi:hypothetical protein